MDVWHSACLSKDPLKKYKIGELEIQDISVVMQQMHLRWLGDIERMKNENWISKCRSLVIDLAAEMGRSLRLGTKLCRTFGNFATGKSTQHSPKVVMERCHQEATVLPMLAKNKC